LPTDGVFRCFAARFLSEEMASKGKGTAAQVPHGSWEGCTVTEEEIRRLQRTRRIPPGG
jgi:hypothetical protein